jgi:transposase
MRRVHLRGHTNIRKRLLIHAGGFNLGLLMRQLIGVGTPRGLQGRLIAILAALFALTRSLWESVMRDGSRPRVSPLHCQSVARNIVASGGVREMAFTSMLGPIA